MKTCVYIVDSAVQLILTPENEFEKNIVKSFTEKNMRVDIYSGEFYQCQGGWYRQANYPKMDSLMITAELNAEEESK